jgi:hypothetical protein
MLRRFSLTAAATAMLALSALPASAAATQPSTHKLSFPRLHGVKAWGTYARTSRGIDIHVCAEDMARNVFAAGAVTVASNAGNTRHANLGAVAFGYHQSICRTMMVRYTSHLSVYTATWTTAGKIGSRSKAKIIY